MSFFKEQICDVYLAPASKDGLEKKEVTRYPLAVILFVLFIWCLVIVYCVYSDNFKSHRNESAKMATTQSIDTSDYIKSAYGKIYHDEVVYDNTKFMDSLTNAELISSFQSEIDYEIRMFDTLDQLRNKSLIYAAKGNRAKSDYWGKKADSYAAIIKAKYIKK